MTKNIVDFEKHSPRSHVLTDQQVHPHLCRQLEIACRRAAKIVVDVEREYRTVSDTLAEVNAARSAQSLGCSPTVAALFDAGVRGGADALALLRTVHARAIELHELLRKQQAAILSKQSMSAGRPGRRP